VHQGNADSRLRRQGLCYKYSRVRILHEDEHVLAIDKPAGVLTVPGRGTEEPALLEEVRAIAPQALPVHRLDRGTSGVVLFALTPDAHRELNAAFESRRAEKTYLALVRGDLAKPRQVDLPIAEVRGGRMRAGGKGALPAQTRFEPRERFGGFTYCVCHPRTGRRHQIRVHLAEIGHPLAVDPRYGDDQPVRVGDLWSGAPDPDTVVLDRTPLHAAALRIPNPGKRGWLSIESPLPDDMARCLDLLRAARRYA